VLCWLVLQLSKPVRWNRLPLFVLLSHHWYVRASDVPCWHLLPRCWPHSGDTVLCWCVLCGWGFEPCTMHTRLLLPQHCDVGSYSLHSGQLLSLFAIDCYCLPDRLLLPYHRPLGPYGL